VCDVTKGGVGTRWWVVGGWGFGICEFDWGAGICECEGEEGG